MVLQKDLEYWGIDELMMEPCCALKYYPEIETCVNEKQVKTEILTIYQCQICRQDIMQNIDLRFGRIEIREASG